MDAEAERNEMISPIAHILLAGIMFAQPSPSASDTLCYPAIVTPKGLDLWTVADKLEQSHRYVSAACAYYQLFLCDDRGWTPINPLVRDYKQLEPFERAVRAATEGKFVIAAVGLNKVLEVLPQFGEARFLMGVFQWSAGKHAEAKSTWRSTLTAPYFTMPPDLNQTPKVAKEAAIFLRWASEQQ